MYALIKTAQIAANTPSSDTNMSKCSQTDSLLCAQYMYHVKKEEQRAEQTMALPPESCRDKLRKEQILSRAPDVASCKLGYLNRILQR